VAREHGQFCEHKELHKEPATLVAEISQLIRDVTSGAVWPSLSGVGAD